jgi:hypothetical protein
MFVEVVNVIVPFGRAVTVRLKAGMHTCCTGIGPNSICLMTAKTRALHLPQLWHWAIIYCVRLRTRISCICSER